MSEQRLHAHSLAEAYLYLMATPCPSCGQGPLQCSDAECTGRSATQIRMTIRFQCESCGHDSEQMFILPPDADPAAERQTTMVNPTEEPSAILDVGQWIMLFRMIVEAANRQTDRRQTRQLGLEAARCLEEALKFYDDPDSDLPPPSAFYTDASRERFQDAPQHFSRQRLIDLRRKLPTIEHMRKRIEEKGPQGTARKKRWWRRGSD